MTIFLSQQEGDALISMEKHYTGKDGFSFPTNGSALHIPLSSINGREEFILDVTSGRIELRKHTLQTRARKTVILARLDICGPPHRNPDGEEILCPHLHLYKEGFGDKWAAPLPPCFSRPENSYHTLGEFMDYCHIVTKPRILWGLFAQ